jgi:hypothetical protein
MKSQPITALGHPGTTQVVRVRVVVTLSEFAQVRVEAPDGWQYVINRYTPGIDFRTLREGDALECEVTTQGMRQILRAQLLN